MFWVAFIVVMAVALWLAVKFANWQRAEANRGSAEIVCPHCLRKGHVRVTPLRRKKGISGGKATAAILTLGTSMLATGLSRKERVLSMRCSNCHMRWDA